MDYFIDESALAHLIMLQLSNDPKLKFGHYWTSQYSCFAQYHYCFLQILNQLGAKINVLNTQAYKNLQKIADNSLKDIVNDDSAFDEWCQLNDGFELTKPEYVPDFDRFRLIIEDKTLGFKSGSFEEILDSLKRLDVFFQIGQGKSIEHSMIPNLISCFLNTCELEITDFDSFKHSLEVYLKKYTDKFRQGILQYPYLGAILPARGSYPVRISDSWNGDFWEYKCKERQRSVYLQKKEALLQGQWELDAIIDTACESQKLSFEQSKNNLLDKILISTDCLQAISTKAFVQKSLRLEGYSKNSDVFRPLELVYYLHLEKALELHGVTPKAEFFPYLFYKSTQQDSEKNDPAYNFREDGNAFPQQFRRVEYELRLRVVKKSEKSDTEKHYADSTDRKVLNDLVLVIKDPSKTKPKCSLLLKSVPSSSRYKIKKSIRYQAAQIIGYFLDKKKYGPNEISSTEIATHFKIINPKTSSKVVSTRIAEINKITQEHLKINLFEKAPDYKWRLSED